MTMLSLDLPSYNLRCQYKEIKIEELIKYADKVNMRFGTNTLFEYVKSIEPQVFNSEHRITTKRFLKLVQKYHKSLRKYTIVFQGEHFKGYCYAHLGIKVILRSKYGDKDDKDDKEKSVEITGYGCNEYSFNAFVDFTLEELQLKKLHETTDSKGKSIISRYDASILNPEILHLANPSIRSGHYDSALKLVISLVETKLREKCLAAGRNEAQQKTGADLAVLAFNKQNGCLNPPWPIATEAHQGVQLMFQGFFMYLRNAFAHNVVVMGEDNSSVFECISTCEFLLKIIEKSTVR